MTTRIKTIIVDDEPLARQGLRILLQQRDDFELLAECENGSQTLQAITQYEPDVILLDIQMPGKDGIEVVQSLQGDYKPLIVFVTAYNQYAIEAFEVQAVDYILKPVDPMRFKATLDRCKERLNSKKLSNEPESSPLAGQLNILDGKKLFCFKHENIYWIESAGDYINIYTEKESDIIKATLKSLENQLPSTSFLRIHRSTIINTLHVCTVTNLSNGEYQIELHNGKRLRSGRKYKNEVRFFLENV